MLTEGIFGLLASADSPPSLVRTMLGESRADQTSGVFQAQAPEGCDLPFIVYSQISGEGAGTMEGANVFHSARYEFSCYAKTFIDAKRLQRAVRRVLEGYRGTLHEGTEVDTVLLVSELDDVEDDADLFRCPIDFEFLYRDLGT